MGEREGGGVEGRQGKEHWERGERGEKRERRRGEKIELKLSAWKYTRPVRVHRNEKNDKN